MPQDYSTFVQRNYLFTFWIYLQIKIEQLMEFFSGVCGPIAFAKMAGDNNHQTRFAFIEFEKRESVQTAVDSCNGIMLGDRAIKSVTQMQWFCPKSDFSFVCECTCVCLLATE